MEILQENKDYRVILERRGSVNLIELHERKTGISQTISHDPVNMDHNKMEALRKDYARIPIEKIVKAFDRWGVEKVKIYKENI